ncbi:MAG: flavin-dependent oxidoreductase [Myxococcota bacterium]
MRVLVAGAGIGGLTTALALQQRGIDVRVYESARTLSPLGVGINLLPHAMAELAALGLQDEIAALGVCTAELCYFNAHGQLIWREPRGLDAGYPVPQVSVHRGKLQLALFDAARKRLPPGALRTGCHLESFANEAADAVRAAFTERASGGVFEERAELLVAADGIHSAVRRQLHPHEGLPRFSGNILWRATSRARPFLTGRSMIMVGSRARKFVAYPIDAPGDDGQCTINWIAELDRSAGAPPAREDWNKRGAIADFLPAFDGFRFDWLDVPALVRSAEAVFEFPMVDRDPLARWTRGRATLLGDAAHPMYPIGSNGASQAILDARALADALVEERDVDAALERYESARRPATAQIVLSNRQHGPECVLDLAEERAPGGFARVDDVFAPGELAEIAARYKRVAGFARESSSGRAR